MFAAKALLLCHVPGLHCHSECSVGKLFVRSFQGVPHAWRMTFTESTSSLSEM